MDLSEKIDQWKSLKRGRSILDDKIKSLRKDILNELGPFPGRKEYGVEIQVRDLTTYAEDRVYNLMHFRKIPTEAFTVAQIDETKIEELYLNGDITDDDLRYIRDPRYVSALIESKEAEEDVQE